MSYRLAERVVAAMYADYESGMSLAAVGRKHRRDRRMVREVFERRELPIRPSRCKMQARLPNGQIAPLPTLGVEQIEAIIAGMTQLRVPIALKQYWRSWDLPMRAAFIAAAREVLRLPGARPETPFSDNVEPFDYGSENAWEIMRLMNAGRDSRTWATKINIASQGVIWDGRLWFWSRKVGYQLGIRWTPETGRPLLHHAIWEKTHRREVPSSHVVFHLDGNDNNLAPGNLALKTRAILAVENKQAGVRARENTARFFRFHAGAAALAAL